MSQPSSHGTLVSVGYEGRDLEGFVSDLQLAGVEVLIDVRLTPISRKPGFSKTRLRSALEEAGIEYQHLRELGNPKENRDGFRHGTQSARDSYTARLSTVARESFEEVIDLSAERVVALLCFEREHHTCHRSCITDRALAVDPGRRLQML